MATEEEAINNLMAQFEEAPQEEAPAEETTAEAPKEADAKIDVAAIIKQATEAQSKVFEEKLNAVKAELQPKKEEAVDEEAMMIEEARKKIGLDMEAQQAAKQLMEERKQAQLFAQVEKEFKNEFPDINLKEMGEWADKTGLIQMLNSGDINQWRIVGNLMKEVSKSPHKPDPVTPSANKGAETTVWERKEKGEEVSDLEIGAEILKKAGHY